MKKLLGLALSLVLITQVSFALCLLCKEETTDDITAVKPILTCKTYAEATFQDAMPESIKKYRNCSINECFLVEETDEALKDYRKNISIQSVPIHKKIAMFFNDVIEKVRVNAKIDFPAKFFSVIRHY
jgi:hypothetical protein